MARAVKIEVNGTKYNRIVRTEDIITLSYVSKEGTNLVHPFNTTLEELNEQYGCKASFSVLSALMATGQM